MKSYFNCVEWNIKDFYKINVEKSITAKFQFDGLTGNLKLRSQNSNVNDVIPTKMFLQMQIYKQMVNTPWNFFDSVVKFEAYVKRSAGDLDYDFENFSPRKLLKYPAIDSEFIYDEEIHFDFEMLKEQELNHSKDGSVTFVVFVTINDMMYSAKADINVYPNLYETDVLTDFKIICNGRKFAAHRVVLGEISPVFLRMLQTEMKESKTCEVVINDIDEDIMVEMIRFIYTGMANLNGIIAEKLLKVADKYGIEKMKLKCIEFLNWDLSVENAIETLVLAEQYEAEDLFNNCNQFIRVHFDELQDSVSWRGVDGMIAIQVAKDLNKHSFVSVKLSS